MAITADTLVAIAVVEQSSTTNADKDESRYGMTGKLDIGIANHTKNHLL